MIENHPLGFSESLHAPCEVDMKVTASHIIPVFGDKFRTDGASVSIHGTLLPPTDGSLLLLQEPC